MTKDEVTLSHCIDLLGNESSSVLLLAKTNAINQSGKKNAIDAAILAHAAETEKMDSLGTKLAEVPFTFEARKASCVTRTQSGRILLICKGAFEEVLSVCSSVRLDGGAVQIREQHRLDLSTRVEELNANGYRVILVATRDVSTSHRDDENFNFQGLDTDLTAEGLLTFLDPLKDDAQYSVARLQQLGVDTRILTGDNLGVALKICRDLKFVQQTDEVFPQAVTGSELSKLEETDEFHKTIKHCKVFAKLTPIQKGQVIDSLKLQGEVVGMLGDGINDAVALRKADAGISVHTATNVAKDSADILLTDKNLSVIVDCVLLGRITQGNT